MVVNGVKVCTETCIGFVNDNNKCVDECEHYIYVNSDDGKGL